MFIRGTELSEPVWRLRDEMDRLFGNFFETYSPVMPFGAFGRRAFPAINVWEGKEALYAEAELPGLTMEDIEVYVVGDQLTIQGERKDPEGQDQMYHRRERGTGAFSRVLHLPVEVDADKVHATLRDGVLTIELPKAKTAMPRRIEVKG